MYREGAAQGHGVPGVDRQVQQGHLQLIGIDDDGGEGGFGFDLHAYHRTYGPRDQSAHAFDKAFDIRGLGAELLLACEREQPLRQGGPSSRALDRPIQEPV